MQLCVLSVNSISAIYAEDKFSYNPPLRFSTKRGTYIRRGILKILKFQAELEKLKTAKYAKLKAKFKSPKENR